MKLGPNFRISWPGAKAAKYVHAMTFNVCKGREQRLSAPRILPPNAPETLYDFE